MVNTQHDEAALEQLGLADILSQDLPALGRPPTYRSLPPYTEQDDAEAQLPGSLWPEQRLSWSDSGSSIDTVVMHESETGSKRKDSIASSNTTLYTQEKSSGDSASAQTTEKDDGPFQYIVAKRAPTLLEVLKRRTAKPYTLDEFYIYMRDVQQSINYRYLDFWYAFISSPCPDAHKSPPFARP